jgi:multidrug resistance efflux pump
MKPRTLLIPLALLAAAAAIWVGRGASLSSLSGNVAVAGDARPTPPVRTLVAPGRVEARRDPVALTFETQGRIVAIEVDEGDAVKAGAVIARLDDRLARAHVAGAEAALAAAKARLSLARRGPRAEDVAAARAEAAAAAAAARHRGVEQARTARLGEVGAVASAAVDADTTAAAVERARADAADARYRSLALGTRSEQVDEAAAAVAAAAAELDAASVALDQTVLRAPQGGVILRRTAEVGALVVFPAPQPVATLVDLGQLELRAEIDEADLAGVTPGQAGYATADAFGDRRFPLTLKRVTRELGRKTVRDDDPRARVDTRVLEVIATFTPPPEAAALPLGLRMALHLTPPR